MLEINKMLLFVAFCYFLYFVVNLRESGKAAVIVNLLHLLL